jgi:hypothetical protein
VILAEPTLTDSAERQRPVRRYFGRRKFDRQPTQPARVVVAAATGAAFPPTALKRAVELSGGDAVGLVTIARVYGSSLGLPNPGLMPSRREMTEQREHLDEAITKLERRGVTVWGQIAATRKPSKVIAQVALARGADHVIVVRPEVAKWRHFVEGDPAQEVAKKLGSVATVEAVGTSK